MYMDKSMNMSCFYFLLAKLLKTVKKHTTKSMWKALPPPVSFKCVTKKKYWRRKTKTLPWPDRADPYLPHLHQNNN